MNGTDKGAPEKGGARESNPIWGELDPIYQRNLSSGATSAIGPKIAIGAKKENEEVGANCWENEGLVRT